MNALFSIPVECQLCTTQQSREMDTKTIEEFGIDGFTLMEIAASSAADHIKNMQGPKKSGLFVCGKGNNAGDALAAARYLVNDSLHKATIYLIFGDDNLSPDAGKNLSLLYKLKDQGAGIEFIDTPDALDEHQFDYLVDGIFGTGLKSGLRSPLPDLVRRMNSFSMPVYSMDVPSGLHADTGEILKECIKADTTFTFGSNKIGLHWKQAKSCTGNVVFCNLPFPAYSRKREAVLINKKFYESLPDIKREARHKYDGGVVHIMAGSTGLTGAAIMAAKSAWKEGAGAVFLYAPKALLPVYEFTLPNIIKVGVGKEKDRFFRKEHATEISRSIDNKKGVFLAGPGIGTKTGTGECLLSVLKEHEGFAILDADALSFWEELNQSSISADQKGKWLLTPHIGEASKHLKAEFNNDFERLLWARKFTDQTNISLLLKGNPTVLSFIHSNNYVTGYDTSIFSRAGFGDVLSGALASFTSISENLELASATALYSGYKKFLEFADNRPFGPEHMI